MMNENEERFGGINIKTTIYTDFNRRLNMLPYYMVFGK